jgi:hypothetical protein
MAKHKVVRTEEHKQRIREAVKASWTAARKAQYSEDRTGLGNPMYGKTHTEEYKAEHSITNSGAGNPFYGKTHSAQVRLQMSQFKKGTCKNLYKYGISDEEYKRQLAAGNLWCFFHRGFFPATEESGKGGICIACSPHFERKTHLRRKFGVDQEWYDSKLESQNGVCDICGVDSIAQNKRHMCIDHDHETGALRGILCAKCNTSIERIEMIPNWSILAMAYLMKYRRAN